MTSNINATTIALEEQKIRNKFLALSPYSRSALISYQEFSKSFPPPTIYEAYPQENLAIIDLHLRYHQYISQKMAIYKWAPSLCFVLLTRFSLPGLIFPLFYTKFVDYYFKEFFIWKESDKKIISIRKEFITKLSKLKNKMRRVNKYRELFPQAVLSKENVSDVLNTTKSEEKDPTKNEQHLIMKNKEQMPKKYMKFGEFTQYIFHTSDTVEQESSICLTPIFQNYMACKSILNWDSFLKLEPFKCVSQHFSSLHSEFLEFRRLKKQNKLPASILIKDYQHLLTFKDIKEEQVCNLTNQIEARVRRMLETWKYHMTGQIFMSGFSMTQLAHLNKHYDLLEPQRFNLQSNAGDYVLFYAALALPKILQVIIRRSVRM